MSTEVPEAKLDLVAKEIELTQLLASNDPKTRSVGIKQIKQLLLKNSEDSSDAFQLNDYLIIWRGLSNFMWTSDKPIPQESVIEKLSYLIHSCTSYEGKIFFLDAFFLTIKDNWMSIRQHHIDTCMMCVRHYLRQLLLTFVNCDWNLEYMNKFSEVLYRALKLFTPSLKTDLQEIFLEELAKISRGKVPTEALVIILDSFLHYISELNDFMLISEVTQNVFRKLLSPSPDLETLTAKFQASQKIVDPGNDLELVESDIANDSSNQISENLFDPQAGNVSVEIPRIKFNPKDVVKVLNKYLTEVDCTRKCLWEITKLIQFYNRLGDCILPNRPKDLKPNSQVLKLKKKKHSSKLVKDGVKRLEMVDSKIKKSGLEVHNQKSLKELNKMGDIVVDRGKIGKSMWIVRKSDKIDTLKDNFNVNGSWIVSKDTKIDGTNTVCINDDKPPIVVPSGFNVEALVSQEKIPKKVQNKVSLTPNFKCLTFNSSLKESNSNKRESKSKISKFLTVDSTLKALTKTGEIVVDRGKIGKSMWKVRKSDNINTLKDNFNLNGSWIVSKDTKIDGTNTVCINDDKPLNLVPPGFNVEVLESPKKTPMKVQNRVLLTPSLTCPSVDSSIKELNKMGEIVELKKIGKSMWKERNVDNVNTLKDNFNLNGSWTVSKDTKIDGTNTMCINDGKQPLLAPVGFDVEVLETPEITLTRLQKKVSLTPSLTCPSVDSSIKKLKKMGEIVERRKIGKSMWKERNFDNVNKLKDNFNLNGSWTVSKDTKIDGINTVSINDDKPLNLVPPGFNVEVLESTEKTTTKVQNKILLTPSLTPLIVDSSDEANEKSIQKSNSPFDKICSPNIVNTSHNNSWYLSPDNDGSESNILKKSNPSSKVEKGISLTSIITPDKSSKSLKSPTDEKRVLQRTTTIFSQNKPGLQNDGTPISKVKESTTRVLRKFRKTTGGEEISMFKPAEISNKALEKVRNESFEEGFISPRRSLRLSIKTTKELQKFRKTTGGEEISIFKPAEISNKALEKVRNESFEEGFISPRRSPRLSIKTTKELQKCGKTKAREEISMLKPEEISNKRSESFEEGFGSLRKSPRLSIETRKKLQKCRKTTGIEEISMLKPEEISNKRNETFEVGICSLRKSPRLSIKTTG